MNTLKNLKVIDASTVLAGPAVGTFLAELGADVTKIEPPGTGDVTRSWKLPDESQDSQVSAYFSSVNYLKTYIELDLTSESGLSSFYELVKNADILVTNFKKGDAKKFGIDDAVLMNLNSRLIIAKINGYGEESDRVAYDLILQAESGFMAMNGTSDSGPVKMPVALIDVLAAHHLKEGILLALYERERTKKGKSISVSLYDAAISSLMNQASNYLMTDQVPERLGSLHPNIAPYGELFQTSEGSIITFAIGSNTHFNKLCSVLKLESLIDDQRFSENQNRVANRVELYHLLKDSIQGLNGTDLLSQLRALNVPAGKVKDLEEVFENQDARDLIRKETIEGVITKRITSIIFK